jgi:hypothetical protein
MAIVVNLHRACVNVRLERIEWIRQRRHYKWAGGCGCCLTEGSAGGNGTRGRNESGGFNGVASSHHNFPFQTELSCDSKVHA